MRKIEIILALLIPIVLLLKALEIPGVNSLIILTFGSISFCYMFTAWRTGKLKSFFSLFDLNNPRKTIEGLSGISIAIVCMGVLFKLMHWPGGKINLTVGLIFLLVPIIILLLKRKELEKGFEKLILSRIFYYGFIGLIFHFVPIDSTSQREIKSSNPENPIEAVDSSQTFK